MELLLLMAAATLLIMLLSFIVLTREEREINREYSQDGVRSLGHPVAGD
ncbi:hypothetical protein HNQ07_002869 [Deinococcus metalli]|uniref:Uncharacterized protein n=1 Tax=Deinococcus metalli TaxID=1141878 RepID=A0A7W8NSP3_9DEIO|nr:hypothetical protein [Deinococcus metalli]MBB5377377.1 hypothetical protein [Deinococcus metalli]GHF49980.1 hypothetical protein GCM10017781_28050 [Deinococcus metalli]